MKKYVRLLCFFLVCGICLSVPVQAAEKTDMIEPMESAFFAAHSVAVEKISSTSFRIWFDATSCAGYLDELGASEVHVYRSADGDTWSKVRSYYKEDYPSMICLNTFSHVGYVTYTGAWSGYYYRACVIIYAKDGNSIGERTRYTEIFQM